MSQFRIRFPMLLFAMTIAGMVLINGCNSGEGDKSSAPRFDQAPDLAEGGDPSIDVEPRNPVPEDRAVPDAVVDMPDPLPKTGMPDGVAEGSRPIQPVQPGIERRMAGGQSRTVNPGTLDTKAFQRNIRSLPNDSVTDNNPTTNRNLSSPDNNIAESSGGPDEAELMADLTEPSETTVEVFYVTDRMSMDALANADFLKWFKWPIVAMAFALACGFWAAFNRRWMPGVLALLILGAGIYYGHKSMIGWQRMNRLASNNDVAYSSDLKQPDADGGFLDYGKCSVTIPPDHRVGIVDSPSLQRFEFTEDARKHVILERVVRGTKADFFQDLNDRLDSGSGQTFVFVHGYNVSFENAVKRTAQIAFDLKFSGVPICYSWPSHGGLEDYTRDMANADWTVVHLQEFLSSLFEETQARRIHLIAHSMGNRALMQALDRMSLQWDQQQNLAGSLMGNTDAAAGPSVQDLVSRNKPPAFGQIVMAAPDISADEFRQRYSGTLKRLADQITLYASSRDRALMVSTSVHGHNRAGLAGDEICVVEGIDTIDVSHVDTSLIGHSYYGDNPALIDDLRALIQLSRPTSQRQWLEQVEIASDKVYWKFR